MTINSKLFRLTVCAAILGASTLACSAPDGPKDNATPKPSVSGTPLAEETPIVTTSPVAMEVTEVKAGEGASVGESAAFLGTVQIWADKFDGKPFGKGPKDILIVPGAGQMPGLVQACSDMKLGGVKRIKISAQELLGEIPKGARMDPNTVFYMEVTAKELFPKEEFKIDTIKEGSGDKAAADGDVLQMHYVGRLDNFKDGKVFDSSRERNEPFTLTLGGGTVIAGWEQGLQGMKKGEVRQLSIPHYLAYGVQDKGKIPPKSRLFFEVELLDFVTPGELKSETVKEGKGEAIKSGEKGSFHYTGWLNGFDSDKKFDSSVDRKQPFSVTLGQGQVIKGWDEGLVGMKPGEKRRLTIPYNLAYGPQGRGPTIPPYATLYFEVEYLGPAK